MVGIISERDRFDTETRKSFEYYGHKSIYYNPIGQGCIMSIFQDSNDHLWIGADNEGVYELDAKGKKVEALSTGKCCPFCG